MHILSGLRTIYQNVLGGEPISGRNFKMVSNKSYSNELIRSILEDGRPAMVSRFGANELAILLNYIGVKKKDKNVLRYLKGQALPWWWQKNIIRQMEENAGFFPNSIDALSGFCQLMLKDLPCIDLLGSWLVEEQYLDSGLKTAKKVMLEDLEPFFCENPWTLGLAGKKVLVIHPFTETIEKQYPLRQKIFSNNLMPDFDLLTIKSIQSVKGQPRNFSSWFDALNYMKQQMDRLEYDVCIIGCGAYGMPLAAHAKRAGKISIHLGGVTQLLFGIIGERWTHYYYWPYGNLFNEYWTRPTKQETPFNAENIEANCYW